MPDSDIDGTALTRSHVRLGLVVPGVYFVVSVITLSVWSARGIYPLIGDEPHYLVIGDALWRFGGIDVLAAYESEVAGRVFYPPGLGEEGSSVTSYGHVVPGDRGIFSWHGYLLGWIAGLPVAVLGVEAARWSMVLIGAGIAFTLWWAAGLFFTSPRVRLLVSLALALTYPFLLASIQIFPDFVAGGLALLGITWLLYAGRRQPSGTSTVLVATLVSLLPWLGIKFGPIAAVLLVAMAWLARDRWWRILIPAAVSAAFLMTFNAYAYGSPLGSLTEGTVEFGSDFWIRLAGMMLDQNQGALLFNPILWLGVVGLVPFLRADRFAGGVWLIVFVTLWILGAAHPGWYGGGSFIGRYSWGLALLLMLPAMALLETLLRKSRALFAVAVGASLIFSGWLLLLGLFVSDAGPNVPMGLDFYNKPLETWLESYSVLWYPLQVLMGAFYNPAWVWGYLVNYVWIVVLVGAVVFGALRLGRRWWFTALLLGLVLVVLAGVVSTPGQRTLIEQQGIQVMPGIDAPGTVAGGPIWLMRDGPYIWSVRYSASLPEVDVVARWELVRAMDEQVVAAGELQGTAGASTVVEVPIPYRNLSPRQFFLRTTWTGSGAFAVGQTGVRHG